MTFLFFCLIYIDIGNITILDLDNEVLKFYEIINHSFETFVPKIRLDLNSDQNLFRSNYNFKKLKHKK